MTYLFFLDDSGHDHNDLPYEVRGGVADRCLPTTDHRPPTTEY